MIISLVAAIGENYELGKENRLLWHLPNDLQGFKSLTLNQTLVMGRKTFESIGRPLPKRKTIVLSRSWNYEHPDVLVMRSKEDILRYVDSCRINELFICGGEEIYKLFIPHATKLYLSHVAYHGDADAFFPEIDEKEWRVIKKEEHANDAPPWILKIYSRI